MFGISISELIVILCVVVVFVRPKDLPRLFYTLGKTYAQLRDGYDRLTKTKDELFRDFKIELESQDSPQGDPENNIEYFDPYAQVCPVGKKAQSLESNLDTNFPESSHGSQRGEQDDKPSNSRR